MPLWTYPATKAAQRQADQEQQVADLMLPQEAELRAAAYAAKRKQRPVDDSEHPETTVREARA